MGNLYAEKSRFIFEDMGGKRVLLDCADPLANKSRIPTHRLSGQTHPVIRDVFWVLIQKQKEELGTAFAIPFWVLDILLVSRLIRSSKPIRVLEYGSGQGELSA